jgi:histone acetyltransferase (RNA polymerase elongator complex component)
MEFEIESIEDIHAKYEAMRKTPPEFKKAITEADIHRWGGWVQQLLSGSPEKPKSIPNSFFLKIARALEKRGELSAGDLAEIEERLRVSRGRSHSGVLVITVFTSPHPSYTDPSTGERRTQTFSCQWNCYYCPNQPGQPRSYLEGEPGVLRANTYGFDCRQQMMGRMEDLYNTGHTVDKLEVLILGGTWESYPVGYRDEFIRDIYHAANTFRDYLEESVSVIPLPDSLESERNRNRHAKTKIIGITIETRPDTITPDALAELRRYGCTRVQIGIQHLDDAILKKINRKCTRAQVEKAIGLLKDWGFKIDAHFMPNLPGASPELDRWMLVETLLGANASLPTISISPEALNPLSPSLPIDGWQLAHPELQVDQWKVYPCETTPFTVIEKWYKSGAYMPYPEDELVPILLDMKAKMFPWIRLNRIVRDIPRDYIMASGNRPNLRQDLGMLLKKQGRHCPCIRCREVKRDTYDETRVCYRGRRYEASGGLEYFISCEEYETAAKPPTLYGFVRLRIPSDNHVPPHPSFNHHAFVRELHVYGSLQTVMPKAAFSPKAAQAPKADFSPKAAQHRGIGKTLMAYAEQLATCHGRRQVIVIAGEGTKQYYHKLGYEETHLGYMLKELVSGNA